MRQENSAIILRIWYTYDILKIKFGGSAHMSTETVTAEPPKVKKVYTIEFWRFVFTTLVCIYHLEVFFIQRKVMLTGSSAVEFFFVLAGFLLAMSAKRERANRLAPISVKDAHGKALEYVKRKCIAIYPILAIVIILGALVYPMMPASLLGRLEVLKNTEWEWLMLIGTPFGFADGNTLIIPMWFLTHLLLGGYIYTYALNRHYDFMMFAAPVIGVLGYIFFALNSSFILDFMIPMGFLNAGMVRAFAEMALGISLFMIYEYITAKKLRLIWQILLSILELYAIYRLFDLMFFVPVSIDNFRRIVYVLIIVLLSFSNITLFSRLLNRKLWHYLGKITLTMFLAHYGLIMVYFRLIMTLKTRLGMLGYKYPFAKSIRLFIDNMGGSSMTSHTSPITWKDALLYMLLVIVVSLLILLVIAGIKRFIVKPLRSAIKSV